MDHVAIMKKSLGLIPKIVSGEKSIESRWYQTKRAPWDKIQTGDTVFFKNAGEPVAAEAEVAQVLQLEIKDLSEARAITREYGDEIGLDNQDPSTWGKLPKYCILVWLQEPRKVERPFQVDKEGFGMGTAWLSVDDINKIKIPAEISHEVVLFDVEADNEMESPKETLHSR